MAESEQAHREVMGWLTSVSMIFEEEVKHSDRDHLVR